MEDRPDYEKLFLEERRRREAAESAREEERRVREAAESAQQAAESAREEERRGREAAESAQQAAESAREEERRGREAAESAQQAAESAQQAAERKLRKTTLPEFLNACHKHLHLGLTVQANSKLSTQGNPANANNKTRPERILEWEDFSVQQEAIWNVLMDSDFVSGRHFTSKHTVKESGEEIRERRMGSEQDLHVFLRTTCENQVSAIIKQLYGDSALRQKFGLKGSVKFENHANTLSPELQLEEGMEQMTVSGTRLEAKAKGVQSSDSMDATEPAAAGRAGTSLYLPRADQFCVYNTSTRETETSTRETETSTRETETSTREPETSTREPESHIAAFIMEYKAPHKLKLGYIYEGLGEMELKDVIPRRETESSKDRFRRLVAAVITQAFSYMVAIGVEYGCVCTGEASIFLRVPDDPKTVYYYLSVPKGDVGKTTGWTPNSQEPNRLHLTAMGQMLAFTLQALKVPQRSLEWRAEAAAQLNTWTVMYEDLLHKIPPRDAPSSEYRPPRDDRLLRISPIRLRPRPVQTGSPSCRETPDQHEDSSDEEPDPDTPSRQPSLPQPMARTHAPTGSSSPSRSSQGGSQSGQYCTQKCVLGLVEGGPLDTSCPNVRDHGDSRHRINLRTFLALIRGQLAEDLDIDCKPVGRPGSCGVHFWVRLKSHGYVVAAKATPVYFAQRLKREATIYRRLRRLQGIHVPVYLGDIALARPYLYEGIVWLTHMMFLSFGGRRISQHLTAENWAEVNQLVDLSAQAIHKLGVLHNDLEPRNILWNKETKHAMVIDFERAEVVKRRTVLDVPSPNGGGKRGSEASMAEQEEDDVFAMERRGAAIELEGLAVF
ncbi:hypothetical protein BU26DRAFT_514154 [Trematosphaeria pertusa]|uniref:Protein kinase domain-containing protein n=1 Tax=Trematosphaeria pertusa TaxID=390896 RepID=A0A6A6IV85_9PLEO|nr:uncharacterized protein BU26DRAFT_514154 [Trematosphaeria pertusa]KAF2254148.1 hypothetical protein BU26DRAFT_514154 [Trematosphaeria pertusa]